MATGGDPGGELSQKQICQPCEREDNFIPAVKWCTECEECMCSDCERFHRKNKSSKDHHVVDISCIDKFSAVVDRICPYHTTLHLNLFCFDHDELCCQQCMTEKHRTCQKLLPVDVVARDVRSSTLLNATFEEISALVTTFDSIEVAVDKGKQSVYEQKETALKIVKAREERLRQGLEYAVKQLRQQIDSQCTEYIQKVEKQTEYAQNSKDILKIKKEQLQHMIEYGSESQIFLFVHLLKTTIAKERSMCENVLQGSYKLDIKCTENQTFVINPESVGDISFKSIPLAITDIKYQNAQDVENFTDHNKTLHFSSKFDFKLDIKIRGIAITEDDNVLLCERNTNSVFLFSASGQYMDLCKTIGEPYNICVLLGLDEAVVTLPYMSKLEFISLSSMISIRDVQCVSDPWGITATTNDIIVGYKHQIQFFTRHGEPGCVFNIPDLDSIDICFTFSVDANRIMASCNNFYYLTRNGQITYQHDFVEYRANGIAVDRSKCIYIATKNKILRLSEDGKVLDDNVLDSTSAYGVVWGISFNNTFTKLYASTHNGDSLTVFDFK